ncbi:restriction endonuclease subunit S [Flavobacterium sp.]|jgi:restriction endonuclease S subunit|uniref:restriction endonuclease subunit S n=1 Tax=Flavobacterium sp. TaxID=239 RepID=UPI0037C1A3E8
MNYIVPEIIDLNKIFLVNRKDTEGRLDAYFYKYEFQILDQRFNNSKYDIIPFREIIVSINNGFDFRDYKDEGTPYIKVANVKPGEFDFNKMQYIEFDSSKISKNIQLKQGNLLLTRKGTFGNALSLDQDYDYIISSEVFYIELNQSKVNSKYLEIFFNSNAGQKQFLRHSIGAIMGSLSQEAVKNLKIPLPPLPIQKEIVAIYNKAYQNKIQKEQKAKKLLDNIDIYLLEELGIELPQELISVEQRIFTTSLSELTGSRFDPDYLSKKKYLLGRNSKYEFTHFKNILLKSPQYGANEEAIEGTKNQGVRYIRITDIDEFGNLKNDIWKTANTINENYILEFNDILIARTGATVGKSYIFKEEKLEAIFAGYMIRFVIDTNKANPDFVFYYLNSKFYKYWISAIQRPSAQPNINSQEYKSLPFVLPPINKQNEIALNIFKIREEAKRLKQEANKMLENAKAEVEKIILG